MEQHVVHAHDERGGDLILAGRGQDDLLRAALEVAGGLLGGVVGAGGLPCSRGVLSFATLCCQDTVRIMLFRASMLDKTVVT